MSLFKIFLISTICFLSTLAIGQKTEKIVEIHIFGPYYPVYNKCKEDLQTTFGFKEVMKGRYETKKSIKHNIKVEKKLLKRNGLIWRRNYQRKLRECKEEENE